MVLTTEQREGEGTEFTLTLAINAGARGDIAQRTGRAGAVRSIAAISTVVVGISSVWTAVVAVVMTATAAFEDGGGVRKHFEMIDPVAQVVDGVSVYIQILSINT